MAARVHLVERDGRSTTLCEVPDGDVFADIHPTEVTIDKATVRIWKEAGVVCALAPPLQWIGFDVRDLSGLALFASVSLPAPRSAPTVAAPARDGRALAHADQR